MQKKPLVKLSDDGEFKQKNECSQMTKIALSTYVIEIQVDPFQYYQMVEQFEKYLVQLPYDNLKNHILRYISRWTRAQNHIHKF